MQIQNFSFTPKSIISIVALILLIVLLVMFVFGGSRNKVQIGVIIPLNGDAMEYGQSIKSILDYQVKQVNKSDSAKQKNVEFELVYYDGKCDATATESAYQELRTTNPEIQVIIGGACSGETLALGDSLNAETEDMLLALSPVSASSEIQNKSTNLFSLGVSNAIVGVRIAEELSQYGRVALISENIAYTQDLRNQVMSNLSPESIVINEEFESDEPDLTTLIQRVRNTNPDVIFLNPNVGESARKLATAIANHSDLNQQVALVGQSGYLASSVITSAQDALQDMVVIDTPHLADFQDQYDTIEKTAKNKSLDSVGVYHTASTVDSVGILTTYILDNMDQDQMINVESVMQDLRTKEYSGNIGTIRFEENVYYSDTGRYIVKDDAVVIEEL